MHPDYGNSDLPYGKTNKFVLNYISMFVFVFDKLLKERLMRYELAKAIYKLTKPLPLKNYMDQPTTSW